MKRATIVTGVTVVGLAWLLNYKVTPPQLTALSPASPTQGPGNSITLGFTLGIAFGRSDAAAFALAHCAERHLHRV
jgi:hypothetical protein